MELTEALADRLGLRPAVLAGRISVYLPALDDTVRIDAAEVRRHRPIWAPTGDPAVEIVLGDDQGIWPLILTPTDVVYQPAVTEVVLDSRIAYRVGDAPDLVAYTEMQHDAERLAARYEQPGSVNLDAAAAGLLLVRCFVAGATLVGLRPVRTVAWWQRAWAALGGDVPLPPFRPDPLWDELARADVTLTPSARVDETPGEVGIGDFAGLPVVPVGLDEEFVTCWRDTIALPAARFAGVLLDGLPGARADVALYPGGGGGVDVTVPGARVPALVQVSWSDKDELHIDEVRIPDDLAHTGLFQRLMFNTERLAAMLGFRRVGLLATERGTYAFAIMGYPRDPELHRALRHGR